MSSPRRRFRTLGLAVTLAAAAAAAGLSGCASSSSSAELSAEDSPLVKLLGPLAGIGDSDAQRAQNRKVEEATARCMKDRGFEYTPVDWSAPEGDDPSKPRSEEWIAKNGYGISPESTASSDSGDETDPNAVYVDSLSASQQEAYFEALQGPGAVVSPEGNGVEIEEAEDAANAEFDPETAGCHAVGQRDANGGKPNFWEDEKYSKLFEKMSSIYEKVEKQPETKAAASAWSECMAKAGFADLKVERDAINLAYEKYEEVYGGGLGGDEPTDAAEAVEPSADEIKAFRALEIKIALADFRCDEKSGYTKSQLKSQFALEEKFIQDNRQKLDELIDAYGDGK